MADFFIDKPGASASLIFVIVTQTVVRRRTFEICDKAKQFGRQAFSVAANECCLVTKENYLSLKLRAIRSV